jgi:L-proline amide hydrolase
MVGKAKRINVPTLVIVGVNELASGEGARPFIDEIPDVELVILEGTTHSPHAEDPERYFEALREFLSS